MNVSATVIPLILATLLTPAWLSGQNRASGLSKAEIEAIVREYILNHPEVLMESVRAHQERERAAVQQKSRDAVVTRQKDLFQDASTPTAGKEKASVEIVQFFDYRCGYCRRMPPVLSKLLEENANVKLIYKELPILGPESLVAARAALAAHKQGAYLAFHQELMKRGAFTQAAVEEIAGQLKLDVAKFRTDMNARDVESALAANQELASAIGVESTPTFVIGKEVISGAMQLADLQALISRTK